MIEGDYMREISVTSITDIIEKLCIKANKELPCDIENCLHRCAECETDPLGKSVLCDLEKNLEAPSDDFVGYLLKNSEGINQKITRKVLDENTEIVRSAFKGFIDKKILDRVGLTDKRIVKIEEKKEEAVDVSPVLPVQQSEIVTTEEEKNIYNYAKQRLAFLIDTDELYQGLNRVEYKDYKTTFVVFYKRERSGKLFTLVENSDGTKTFSFPSLNKEIQCKEGEYKDIDISLLECYKKAFSDLK